MIDRLVRDSAVYALAAIVSRGVVFLMVPIYSRWLPAEDYAVLDLIVTAGILVNLVAPLEIGQGLAREWHSCADDAQRRRMTNSAITFTAVMHSIFLLLVAFFAESLAAGLLGHSRYAQAAILGALGIALNGLFLQIHATFRWGLQPLVYGALSVTHGVLTLGLGVLGCTTQGLNGLLWGQAVGGVLATLAGWLCLGPLRGIGMHRDALRGMLNFSWPLVPASLASFAAFQGNKLLLNTSAGLEAVAQYAVGSRIAGLASLLIIGLQGALTPLIYAHHEEPHVPGDLAKLFTRFVAAALLLCVGLSLFSELVIRIADARYREMAGMLSVLAPAALLSQMYIFAPGLALARKTKTQLHIALVAAGASVATTMLLAPTLGAWGAAWAVLLASMLHFGLWWICSQKHYPLPMQWGPVGRCIAFAGTVLAADAVLVETSVWAEAVKQISLLLVLALVVWHQLVRTPPSSDRPAPTKIS